MRFNVQASFPYLEDVMAETGTHREDWLVGAAEINTYLFGRIYGDKVRRLPEMRQIHNVTGGMSPYSWALRKSDADKYRRPA